MVVAAPLLVAREQEERPVVVVVVVVVDHYLALLVGTWRFGARETLQPRLAAESCPCFYPLSVGVRSQ
jgi:hypothetical protein